MTTSYCGGAGRPDDNAAQAGYLVVQPITVTGGVTHTLTSEGADASEDGTGRGTPIVLQPLAVHENQRGEITTPPVMGALKTGGGKPGQGYPCVVHPLALRGREGGAQLEIGPEGGPYNALVTAAPLIAITAPKVATPLTSGSNSSKAPGRRGEDDHNLVALDLRNAARASGTGVGTQGDGWREGGPSYGLSATERAIPGVATETVVRRLTELECERLQGYPDDWTIDQKGSPRYRQLGNSVAVPVVEWVARGLIAVDTQLRGGAA